MYTIHAQQTNSQKNSQSVLAEISNEIMSNIYVLCHRYSKEVTCKKLCPWLVAKLSSTLKNFLYFVTAKYYFSSSLIGVELWWWIKLNLLQRIETRVNLPSARARYPQQATCSRYVRPPSLHWSDCWALPGGRETPPVHGGRGVEGMRRWSSVRFKQARNCQRSVKKTCRPLCHSTVTLWRATWFCATKLEIN
jgi:hypothetical protein